MALAYIGTYTHRASHGIYAYRYDPASGKLSAAGLAVESANASFLAAHPNARFVYAVNEASRGAVSAFRHDPDTARLTPINQVASQGADPCHLTADATGRWLAVANYSGGNIALFAIAGDGSLGEAVQVVQHEGSSGADAARQEAPHVHSVEFSPDNRFLYTNDLGKDQILVYSFDAAAGRLTFHRAVDTARGAGPRHMAFRPDRRFAYGINELFSSITAYRHDAVTATLEALQTIDALPPDYKGRRWGAEVAVHPNGRFLYASNRAHDSIAAFGIDATSGRLTAIGRWPAQGVQPRHFTLDPTGAFLHVANADSDTLVTFAVDAATGALKPTGQVIEAPEPVCILFV